MPGITKITYSQNCTAKIEQLKATGSSCQCLHCFIEYAVVSQWNAKISEGFIVQFIAGDSIDSYLVHKAIVNCTVSSGSGRTTLPEECGCQP